MRTGSRRNAVKITAEEIPSAQCAGNLPAVRLQEAADVSAEMNQIQDVRNTAGSRTDAESGPV